MNSRPLPQRLLVIFCLVALALAQQDTLSLTDRQCTQYFRNETFTNSTWLWKNHITNFNYGLFYSLNPNLTGGLPDSAQNITDILQKASRDGPVTPTSIFYPLAVSYDAVVEKCGATSGFYVWPLISDTLTTWILPLFGLIVSLPWESNRRTHTILLIFRWMGSPFATLTYIFWNLRAIGRAATLADLGVPGRSQNKPAPSKKIDDEENGAELDDMSNVTQNQSRDSREADVRLLEDSDPNNERFSSVRDSFAILCVMNQYKLSSRLPISESTLRVNIISALFLDDDAARRPGLAEYRSFVAVEIRRVRKRGVVPVLASLGWYFFALAISMYKAFGDVGDNATAHNLALGLLMGWLPVLVATAIIDRNTVDSEHVAKLLNKLMQIVHNHEITFTKFVGQGRRRWHYGVAHPILSMLERYPERLQRPVDWAHVAEACKGDDWPGRDTRTSSINYFNKWEFVHMLAAWLTLGMSVLGAWYISYNTPTVGLGCRSFSYVMFLVFCTLTGIIELALYPIIYRPVKKRHTDDILAGEGFRGYLGSKKFRGQMNGVLVALDVISTLILLLAVFMQTTGGFQFYWCRASRFGHRGGYVVFDGAVYLKRFFDAKMYWMIGAIISSIVPALGVLWTLREWLTQSFLWSNDVTMARRGLRRVRIWKGFWWWVRLGGMLNLKFLKRGVRWRP